jgi:diaminohydroxyphosphoribosylaminopyrimidine deaminase / 5-amino-6-(5-phosphoribosylamino)uracil reductase
MMALAHRLALDGWGTTWPNPMVGAVLVRNGEVIGTGRHLVFGGEHAERNAFARVSGDPRGATLYVTLEPCNHQGQQPPCTRAIIAAGIARVVIGAADPNPEAAGGAEALRSAGIDVSFANESSPGYNFRFMHRFGAATRPFVAIKLAVSMDGMIADAAGNARWLSSAAAREWVHWLRAGFGAIAVGGRTAVTDGALLTVRGAVQPRLAPVRVVFDRSGVLPPEHPMLADSSRAPVTVVASSAVAPEKRSALSDAGARVLVADSLADALAQLRDCGIDSILVEGGGRLAGALLSEELVDRVYQVQCPLWLGEGTPAWPGLGAPELTSTRRWRITNTERLGETGDGTEVILELER